MRAMTQATPTPGIIPYLAMGGQTAAACDFYIRAFGAEDAGRMPRPDGEPGLMHAQLRLNGGMLMMTDHMGTGTAPAAGFGHLQLEVPDARAWWDRAVAAGCTVALPFARQPWGDEWGLLRDPFGIHWGIMQVGAGDAA
jgi:PhnB protein